MSQSKVLATRKTCPGFQSFEMAAALAVGLDPCAEAALANVAITTPNIRIRMDCLQEVLESRCWLYGARIKLPNWNA